MAVSENLMISPARVTALTRAAGVLRGTLMLVAALGLTPVPQACAGSDSVKTYYRYINDQGVKVLNHQIPPEYVQKGYEVVTATGAVVRVVEPAPSEEEADALRRQREVKEALLQWDEELLRRYSSVRDIESTKKRKLAQVQTSIDILKSNISNIKSQIAVQHSKAANAERLGREVPQQVLTALTHLEEELQLNEEQLAQRRNQFAEVTEKYENDKERFRTIRPGIP